MFFLRKGSDTIDYRVLPRIEGKSCKDAYPAGNSCNQAFPVGWFEDPELFTRFPALALIRKENWDKIEPRCMRKVGGDFGKRNGEGREGKIFLKEKKILD